MFHQIAVRCIIVALDVSRFCSFRVCRSSQCSSLPMLETSLTGGVGKTLGAVKNRFAYALRNDIPPGRWSVPFSVDSKQNGTRCTSIVTLPHEREGRPLPTCFAKAGTSYDAFGEIY